MTCYVYFISDGEYVKIGISRNVKSRLSGLQTSNPKQLSLLHQIECIDSDYASLLEQAFHRNFDNFCVSGEWFNLEWDVIKPQIEGIKEATPYPKPEIPRYRVFSNPKESIFSKRTASELAQIRFNSFVINDLLDNYPPMKHFPNLGTDVDNPRRIIPKQWKHLRELNKERGLDEETT